MSQSQADKLDDSGDVCELVKVCLWYGERSQKLAGSVVGLELTFAHSLYVEIFICLLSAIS